MRSAHPSAGTRAVFEVVTSETWNDPVHVDGEVTFGRKPEPGVFAMGDRYMSGRHARVRCAAGRVTVTDLDSKNRTFVNEQPLTPHQERDILPGDTVRMGSTVLRLQPHLSHSLAPYALPCAGNRAVFEVVTSETWRDPVHVDGEVTFGRKPASGVFAMGDRYMSGRHARVRCAGGRVTVTDLDSKNRTYVNEQPLTPPRERDLRPGDTVRMGSTVLRLQPHFPHSLAIPALYDAAVYLPQNEILPTAIVREIFGDVDRERLRTQLGTVFIETVASLVDADGHHARLARAELLLIRGDTVSLAAAAFLVSATLEKSLKELLDQNYLTVHPNQRGIVQIASILQQASIISREDIQLLRHFTRAVRNPAMHGDFEQINRRDVEQQIGFTRQLLSRYDTLRLYH